MLTIFAIPKAFRGHFKIIQTNAIRSWTLLRPKPEIILLGDDEGTAEIAKELNLRHIPAVERNSYGTPLVSSIFQTAEAASSNELLCYINSDIILMSDFSEAMKTDIVQQKATSFLLIGRKSNVEINRLLDFDDSNWEAKLKGLVKQKGRYVTYDSDFFVFPKGVFKNIPSFAIGRCFWTQWFIYSVRMRGVPVIDATSVVMSVESKHDYSHVMSTGGAKRLSGVEYESNRRLFKGCKYFTTVDATHILAREGLKENPSIKRLLSLMVRSDYYIYFLLKGTLYPYSMPLIILGRWARLFLQMVSDVFRSAK